MFAAAHEPIAGTRPLLFDHPSRPLYRAVLPAVVSEAAARIPGLVYAALIDRCGYVAAHSHPGDSDPRPDDPLFNHEHARVGRLIDDVDMLRVVRFLQRPSAIAYGRDTLDPATRFVRLMTAPIHLGGRHWGAAQMAFPL
jgi:methyl-accepting chemotaxis protein